MYGRRSVAVMMLLVEVCSRIKDKTLVQCSPNWTVPLLISDLGALVGCRLVARNDLLVHHGKFDVMVPAAGGYCSCI